MLSIETILFIGLFGWFAYKYDVDVVFRKKVKQTIKKCFGE